jgi:hypothetical protein
MGTLAAQLLLHRIRDPNGAQETVQVPTRLLARGSGEIALSSADSTPPGSRPTLSRPQEEPHIGTVYSEAPSARPMR